MDRYVAVKVLPEQMSASAEFRQRFEREAKVIAKLEHAHILPVHDYGQTGNRLYLVMRYIEAGTLKERMGAEPMSLTEVNRVMQQVGSALEHAHRLGVVHRDVKPSNVLLDAQGNCYLTDFGLAKMLQSSIKLTASGVGMGTPAYMSPEQGQGKKIDARSDIYSLGVMLYEMVTGRVPYEAETPMAVVLKHITAPLPLPRKINPGVPRAIERVILKSLAKNPDDRFQTVSEMTAALEAAVRGAEMPPLQATSGLASETPRAGVMDRLKTAAQTGWGRAAIWATGGIAAMLLFAFVLSRIPFQVRVEGGRLEVVRVVEVTPALSPTLSEAEGETPTEAAAAKATATVTPRASATPTMSDVVLPTSAPLPVDQPTVTATPPLTPASTALGRIVYSDGSTGNDEIYVANDDGSGKRRLTDHSAGDWEPAWSPDGTRIVFDSDQHAIGQGRNQLYVMDANGSNLTRLTHTEGNDEHPSWSPDGSRIAFHSGCGVAVINADGSNWTTPVKAREDLCVGFPTWSPDSRRIAFRSLILSEDTGLWQHDIYVVNDDGSGLLKLAAFTSEERSRYAVWSPDGGQVAFDVVLDGQQRTYAVNSDGSGEPEEIHSIPDSWYPWYWPQWVGETTVAPSINPTDQRGQLMECGKDLCILTADGKNVPLGLERSYTQFHGYTWSSDGSQIAFSACLLGNEGYCEELYVADLDNGAVVRLPRQGEHHHPLVPAWSPNGEWIAYHDSGALSVVRPDGTGHREIVPHPYCPTNIAWSPDSSRLAWFAHWCDEDETSPALLLVVNFDGSDRRLLWTRDNANPDVAFSPDGTYLAVRFDDGSVYRVDPECEPGPDGCDESSRTEMDDFPEHWLHTHWPQWDSEAAAAPEPTSTPAPAAQKTTPVPLSKSAISSGNIEQIVQLALLDETYPKQIAWSPDGKLLAIAAYHIFFYDAQTLEQVYVIDSLQWVDSIAFSPDGTILASAPMGGEVQLWDTTGWGELHSLAGSKDTASVDFSPDGTMLATATGGTVKLWDVASGSELRTIPAGSSINAVAFSPDGLTLAANAGIAGQEIKLWDAASGDELHTLEGHTNWVKSVVFSPDGSLLASGSVDSTVRLWDVTEGRQVRVFSGHSSEIESVAFSPDGSLLASASWDLTVRLWDVASGNELVTLTGHSSWIKSVAFSPDGATLGSGGKMVRLWGVAP
ncbi:MAG: hypothetical protein B6I34_06775 [Anaerolineaceae bacterium 4572_32.1]|nr:MAG: hypothetical protein B6I34_06775 [Anaerolineaceae bacterium 4572_32.1]